MVTSIAVGFHCKGLHHKKWGQGPSKNTTVLAQLTGLNGIITFNSPIIGLYVMKWTQIFKLFWAMFLYHSPIFPVYSEFSNLQALWHWHAPGQCQQHEDRNGELSMYPLCIPKRLKKTHGSLNKSTSTVWAVWLRGWSFLFTLRFVLK